MSTPLTQTAGTGRPDTLARQPRRGRTDRVRALDDILGGLARWHIWTLLGWHDIRQRYRRSVIGPFWLTISMGVMVGSLGLLYAQLFRIEVSGFLPFLAVGFIIWGLISGIMQDGCMAFISADGVIKQVKLPFSVHVYRLIWRNLLIFLHNVVIYVVVMAVFGLWPGWPVLLAVPGFAMLLINGVCISHLLGLICARYRDVPQIIMSFVQVSFFLTPIMWQPDLLPERTMLIDLNPFYHLIEVVRTPLLGGVPAMTSWIAVIMITAAVGAVSFLMFARFRARIAYWL